MTSYPSDRRIRLVARKGANATGSDTGRRRELSNSSTGMTGVESSGSANEAPFEQYSVIFELTPDISESGTAIYTEVSEMRAASGVLMYLGSPSRNFTISAKFISRTREEAETTMRYINRLKSWRMPESAIGANGGTGIALSVPTLLFLRGYSGVFKNIPVVMTDLSIELSSEFDYITSSPWDGYVAEVPIITPVTITLKEAHASEASLAGLGTFDINMYRKGTLDHW